MADVASKQQTTALFLSTIVTRTRRHTELTNKLTNLLGKLCCAREHSVRVFVQIFTQLKYTVELRLYGALMDTGIGNRRCSLQFIYEVACSIVLVKPLMKAQSGRRSPFLLNLGSRLG